MFGASVHWNDLGWVGYLTWLLADPLGVLIAGEMPARDGRWALQKGLKYRAEALKVSQCVRTRLVDIR